MGRTARRSLNSAAAQTLPGPALPLEILTNRNGDRHCTPAPNTLLANAGRPVPSYDVMLFGSIKLLRPVFVGCGL